jgi:Protein of unknown function (DUF3124)
MRRLINQCRIILFLSLIIAMGFTADRAKAENTYPLSKGQAVYVPAYSHIYIGDREHPFYLTVTLSIRNIDQKRPLTLISADYYDSTGKFLRKYIDKPIILNPFSSVRYLVNESDKEGGSGASFLVKWTATQPINQPIIESVMIGTKSQQGISFTSRGQVLIEGSE